MEIGYICGPSVIIEQMLKIHQFAIMCAPTNSQYAAIEGLRHCEDEVQQMRNAYNQRRRYLVNEFAKMKLECFEPFGAFYIFPSIKEFGMTSEEFAMRFLEEEKVAVVPGSAFGERRGRISACIVCVLTGRSERGDRKTWKIC